ITPAIHIARFAVSAASCLISASGLAGNIAFPQTNAPTKKITNPMDIVKTKSDAIRVTDFVAIVIATAVGAGFAPRAPGTAGSLVGVAIYLALTRGGASAYYAHVI